MKTFFITLLFFHSLFCFCQNEKAVIKVYLEDAYTGKNISDAKVTLEGFEIPEIVGDYDKKGKFYYFIEIPEGYNTVMAYHEKYNEKGFQDLNVLPNELKLKLYEPFNLSYGFEKPVLSRENCCNQEKNTNYLKLPKTLEKVLNTNEKISNPNFRYIYQEDQYRIAIISKYDYNTFFSNDTIKNILKEYSLEEYQYNDGDYQKYAIDELSGYLVSCIKGTCFTIDGIKYVYIIQKKDGTSFKRFNSIEIKKLRENNFIVATLTNKELEYYANSPFEPNKFHFSEYFTKNSLSRAGKIGITFFSTPEENHKMYYGDFDINIVGVDMPSYDDGVLYSLFFVIPKDQQSSIGLGALDNMEVDKSQVKHYFFNNKFKN